MITFFDLLALFTCIGALTGHFWIGPQKSLWQLFSYSLLILLISTIGLLMEHSIEIGQHENSSFWAIIPQLLFLCHFGKIWIIRFITIFALGIGWAIGKNKLHSKMFPGVMLALCGLVAFTRSATSHSADGGDFSLIEISDWLHLVSGAMLGGGLITFAIVFLPLMSQLPIKEIAEKTNRFSQLAGYSLGIIVLSAGYNTWIEVGAFNQFLDTLYGNLLGAKAILLILLVSLGAVNRYVIIPYFLKGGMDETNDAKVINRFRNNILIEVFLIIAILFCTSILVQQTPPEELLKEEKFKASNSH